MRRSWWCALACAFAVCGCSSQPSASEELEHRQEAERWVNEEIPPDPALLDFGHLVGPGVQKQVEAARKALESWDRRTRRIPDLGRHLTAMLEEERDPQRRLELVARLGRFGDKESIPLLIRVLESPAEDLRVRRCATPNLAWLVTKYHGYESEDAVEALVAVLASKTEALGLRRQAAVALCQIARAKAVEPIGVAADMVAPLGGALLENDGESVSLMDLTDPQLSMARFPTGAYKEFLRADAAEALGYLGGRMAEEYLNGALNDPSEFVREQVVKSLARLRAVALASEHRELLRNVDLSLSHVTLEQGIKALERALHSPIPHRLEGSGFRRIGNVGEIREIREFRVRQEQALEVLFMLADRSGSTLDAKEGCFVFIPVPLPHFGK